MTHITLRGILLATVLLVAQSAGAQSTAELLRKTSRCTERGTTAQPQRDCTFAIGKSLRFEIAGVGQTDAAITIFKADFDGDYYISVGVLHGCAIIKPGKRDNVEAALDYAFVSPATGLVYKTWQACGAATGRTEREDD